MNLISKSGDLPWKKNYLIKKANQLREIFKIVKTSMEIMQFLMKASRFQINATIFDQATKVNFDRVVLPAIEGSVDSQH